MAEKINKPCYFYNTGGCYHPDGTTKTSGECQYRHVKVDYPLEKPQHLKPPCKYFHLRRQCKNGYCLFGHSELTADRWRRYFPTHPYPGRDYVRLQNYQWEPTSPKSTDTPTTPTEVNVNEVKATILVMLLQMLNELER